MRNHKNSASSKITMKLYLDTNIILGWFKRIMQKERKGREFEIPSLLKFLSSHSELELIVSDITRVEIFRYLISEWGCNLESCRKAWDYFIESFEIEVIKAEINFEELEEICLAVPTRKKTLINLLHLQIAKRYKFWFLTGEKELKEKYSNYYDGILTYKELRRLLS